MVTKNESNSASALKAVNVLVDGAIKSSKDHAVIFSKATVATVLFAAEHGQIGPLQRLHKEVSSSDAEGLRLFIVNMNTKYAPKVTDKNGDERPVSFLKYSRAGGGFALNTSADPNIDKGIKAMKIAVQKAGETELSKLAFSTGNREDRAAMAFDEIQTVQRVIRTLAKNGAQSMALAVNRVLGEHAITVGEIEATAKANDPRAKLAEAEKRAEKLREQVANMSNRESPAASAAIN